MRNNQVKILEDEIEQLILTKNGYIKDVNDLNTVKKDTELHIHNLNIQHDTIIANEYMELQKINKDFITSLDSKNQALLTKEECLFVLLAQITTIINKTSSLGGLVDKNVSTIGELIEHLSIEIEKFYITNKNIENKEIEIKAIKSELDELFLSQKSVYEKLFQANTFLEETKIIKGEALQERENVEKEKEYIKLEKERIRTENEKIKSQWQALENTKNYLKGQNQS